MAPLPNTLRSIALGASLLATALPWTDAARAQPAPETAAECTAATDPHLPRILVTVTGARRVVGNITFTLYGDRQDRFLKSRGSIALDRVMLTTTSATTCFAVSRPGIYAVAVYHDDNNDHHFDRSALGLPEKAYGFSRNAPVFLGPPSFDSARFPVGPGETRISIALRG